MTEIRANWAEEDLASALDALKSGCSQRVVAKRFKIPRRTLRNHLQSGKISKKLGRNPVLTDEQEKELCSRIVRFSNIGLPLTPQLIKVYVFEYCSANGILNSFNGAKSSAGRKWLKGFLKRNPSISLRKAQSINPGRAAKLNPHIVKDYFDKLKAVMEEYELFDKPHCIFNMDEKGCRLTLHHQQQVMAQRGAKRVHLVAPEHAENVSLVVCANATGSAIPLTVIFKGKRSKSEYGDNLPPNAMVCMSDKGSMTTELFIKWLEHFSIYKPVGKVLLIFDGASSHLHPGIVDAAIANDVVLFCLPSNTTHELQPMDKSVFKSFEHYWDTEVLKFWRAHPDRVITKARFGSICTPAYNKALSITNICNGFLATGIYPFDPDAIPDIAFAPSTVTFQEQSPTFHFNEEMATSSQPSTPFLHSSEEVATRSQSCTPSLYSNEEMTTSLQPSTPFLHPSEEVATSSQPRSPSLLPNEEMATSSQPSTPSLHPNEEEIASILLTSMQPSTSYCLTNEIDLCKQLTSSSLPK